MWQKLLESAAGVTNRRWIYYKVWEVLQSVTRSYYKVWQVLITKCDNYYKARRNTIKWIIIRFSFNIRIIKSYQKTTVYQKPNLSKDFWNYLIIVLPFLSFYGIGHAYLLKTSITQNKKRRPLLYVLISCISARLLPEILSMKDEYTLRFWNVLIIVLHRLLACRWFGVGV